MALNPEKLVLFQMPKSGDGLLPLAASKIATPKGFGKISLLAVNAAAPAHPVATG